MSPDVLVIGRGNAALCAALMMTTREADTKLMMLAGAALGMTAVTKIAIGTRVGLTRPNGAWGSKYCNR